MIQICQMTATWRHTRMLFASFKVANNSNNSNSCSNSSTMPKEVVWAKAWAKWTSSRWVACHRASTTKVSIIWISNKWVVILSSSNLVECLTRPWYPWKGIQICLWLRRKISTSTEWAIYMQRTQVSVSTKRIAAKLIHLQEVCKRAEKLLRQRLSVKTWVCLRLVSSTLVSKIDFKRPLSSLILELQAVRRIAILPKTRLRISTQAICPQ